MMAVLVAAAMVLAESAAIRSAMACGADDIAMKTAWIFETLALRALAVARPKRLRLIMYFAAFQ